MQAREYQERLAQKTAFLKSLAVDIEGEAKDSHRLLGGVGDDMEGSRSAGLQWLIPSRNHVELSIN